MMKVKKTKVLIFSIIIVFQSLLINSCTNQNDKKKNLSKEEFKQYEKPLQSANRYLTTLDAERIENYAKRRNWNMQVTESGLWYEIYEKGNGEKAHEGQVAVLNFKISLLDGTLCYSSDSIGSKEFSIGQGGVESGLEEGILMLRTGDKARFIMPPYKAHGLLGDMKKIPARSIIVYEIELLRLRQ
jgi:FKBP-type peptidyl-prolyl cis-trans isomerase FkpA